MLGCKKRRIILIVLRLLRRVASPYSRLSLQGAERPNMLQRTISARGLQKSSVNVLST